MAHTTLPAGGAHAAGHDAHTSAHERPKSLWRSIARAFAFAITHQAICRTEAEAGFHMDKDDLAKLKEDALRTFDDEHR